MTTEKIATLINARMVSGTLNNNPLEYGFSSDLLSDVLRLDFKNTVLITGLSNLQTIRTAEMADISTILLARGKKATKEMIELANQNEMTILESDYSVFRISGILYSSGLKYLF